MFYPRHVKHRFTNITVAPDDITTKIETDSTQPTTTTKRQSLNKIVDAVIEGLFTTASDLLTSSGGIVKSTPFVSPTIVPSNSITETKDTTETTDTLTDAESQSSFTVVSVAEPVAISTSSSIILFPTTAIMTDAPVTTPTLDPTTSKPDSLSSLFSEIEDIVTSALPRLNITTTPNIPTSTMATIYDITITPSGTGPITTDPPIVTEITPPPVITDTTTRPPNPLTSTPTVTIIYLVPTTSHTVIPPPIRTSFSNNKTKPTATTRTISPSDSVTSIALLRTINNSQSWLPTTVLLDSTSTAATAASSLAPTTATGIPTELPTAIDSPTAAAQPEDTEIIQIGLLQGYNYMFVVNETKAAAQVFNLLPKALTYAAGMDEGKVKVRDTAAGDSFRGKITVRKLQPLDTVSSLGYITTVVLVSYPRHLIEALRMDIKVPTSALYNNPDPLVYNFTKQINPAIDITIGSGIDFPGLGDGKDEGPRSTGENDPFGNNNKDEKDSSKRAATAGIVTGAVAVAAVYSVAMSVIARRYRKKKQAHRRALAYRPATCNPVKRAFLVRGINSKYTKYLSADSNTS